MITRLHQPLSELISGLISCAIACASEQRGNAATKRCQARPPRGGSGTNLARSLELRGGEPIRVTSIFFSLSLSVHNPHCCAQRIVNASVAEISGRLRTSVNDQVRHELSAALDAAEQSFADVDALLSEKAAFDIALAAATERAIASLCSDVTLRTQAMLQSQEHSPSQLGVADVV